MAETVRHCGASQPHGPEHNTMSKHAENFPPSGAKQWLACPGSIKLVKSLNLPPWTSEPAERGTVAHKLLELALKGQCDPEDRIGKRMRAGEAGGIYTVDAELARGPSIAADLIYPVWADGWPRGSETWLDIPQTGEGGTVDAWANNEKDNILDVWDYKNGRHAVSAQHNAQMSLYALGALAKVKWNNKTKVRLHIIGPNFIGADSPISTYKTTARKLMAWGDEIVRPAVQAHNAGTGKLIAGSHCDGCRAAGRCPALAKKAAQEARMDFAEFIDPPKGCKNMKPKQAEKYVKALSNKEMAGVLKSALYMQAIITAAKREVMLCLAADPKSFPEFKLVAGRANRKWKDQRAVCYALSQLGLDEDEYLTQKLAGLGEVAKLLPAAKREKFMAKHTMKPEGKATLTTADDPREALSHAKIDFEDDIEEAE